MGKKIAINVFYNLGLILSIFGMGWAYNNNSWLIVAFFAATFAAFLFFKIQLLKDVRKDIRK
ncbi:DUF6358 family protein [Pedobacter sp. Hv1]|uniref:DUF6358 family protein n=1 Tax=Pedobacter sp. Hv1 TaxID=1740090 RepID=UPI0006D8B3BF|nr:DUF6358 family protein [Pedobacter sp. Hv1]KQB99263.1 hypothetical protein AQF98_16950 [Pedobacter sp. Hv1]